MTIGSINFVLHAHLPYIKHTHNPYHIEQRWFYESIVESYLPLIHTLFSLLEKKKRFHLSLSLSPPLCAMLTDTDMKNSCETYLHNLIELAEAECHRNRNVPQKLTLSRMYLERFKHILHLYTCVYKRDLIGHLKALHDEGVLSLFTTSASHAYLPLLEDYPEAIHAQVVGGLRIFSDITEISTHGFWLPECGYTNSIEDIMKKLNLSFSLIESHGVVFSKPSPRYSIYRPVLGPRGIILFGRDSVTSQFVWSSKAGYPADPDYRDFHEDAVYELPDTSVKKFVHPDGLRVPSGIKYKRTGGKPRKQLYNHEDAVRKIEIHASDFVSKVTEIAHHTGDRFNIHPIITVAFDAELFGHWWYEGCAWLEKILSGFSESSLINMLNPHMILNEASKLEKVTPENSSWGNKGYHETWINPKNDWMIPYIHSATEMMIDLARSFKRTDDKKRITALNVTAREVFMLQSSDWGFLINNGTSEAYATKRFMNHYKNIMELKNMIENNRIAMDAILEIEKQNGGFALTDFRWFVLN